MKKNFEPLQILKPGSYVLVTPGKDKPGKGFPSKCSHCLKPIVNGDTWRDYFNGSYHVIYHREHCPEVSGSAS